MTKIKIGELADGHPLWCDIETLLDTRMLIQSNSGGGKSQTIRRMLEQTHRHVPQMVLDYEGDFATLREKYDYVLAAAKGGDVVAHPRTAALLAERLLELRTSAIIDIYEMIPRDRILFVKNFLEAVINCPKKHWRPWIIVLDEAHIFAPEKGHADSLDAVAALASLGRKRGFCAWFATQRIAKFNKDAAAECNNTLVGRTRLDVDLKRAGEDLGFSKERTRELRSLSPGEFYASGPAFGVDEAVKVMVGDVETTHPRAGNRLTAHVPPPSAKVRAALAQLADLPAEAEQRVRTVDELRTEVAKLRRELAAAEKRTPAPAPPAKPIEVPILTDTDRLLLADLRNTFQNAPGAVEGALKRMREHMAEVATPAVEILNRVMRASTQRPPVVPVHARDVRGTSPVRTPAHPALAHTPASVHFIGAGERAILTAIAQHGDQGVTSEQLSVLTTYKRSSRDTYLQKLRAAGLIDTGNHGTHTASEAGLAVLGPDFEPLPTGEALRAHWLQTLGGGERYILEEVLAAYPSAIERELLGCAGEKYKRSSRDTYLQKLTARKLVEPVGRGSVRASATLFDGEG